MQIATIRRKVANTVGSGSVTIPLMKKTGYKPEFAAAAEASASTGGQIMPPIMGAAAFLMAENIGVGIVLLVQLLTKKKIKTLNV